MWGEQASGGRVLRDRCGGGGLSPIGLVEK